MSGENIAWIITFCVTSGKAQVEVIKLTMASIPCKSCLWSSMHNTRSLEPPSLMKKNKTTVCFFLKCVSYRHWQPLRFECGAKLDKIKATLKLVLQNMSILWIKFELSIMSLASRGQKTGSKSPSTTSGRFHRAAVHRFSCCLIRLSSVLLAASGGETLCSPTMSSACIMWRQTIVCRNESCQAR